MIANNEQEYISKAINLSNDYEKIISVRKNLFDKNDLQKMNVLRRIIAPMGTMDAIEFINSKLKDTKNNSEFFNSMNKPA